jgi:D-amino-acid dehydrogenase
MACGSARVLADLIDERRPDIDPTPYSPTGRKRHR